MEQNKKYELTDITKQIGIGIILHRIKALRDIPLYGIKAGELGGWIEKEVNLSQDGDCWVSGEAFVYQSARISDQARISGQAYISGQACIYGKARISDQACIYGKARISGQACIYGEAVISDQACIYGKAYIFDQARISGQAYISGQAVISQGKYQSHVLNIITHLHSITAIYPNHVQVGCKLFEIPKTKKVLSHIMFLHNIDEKYTEQYWLAAKMAKQWIKDNPEPLELTSTHKPNQ